MTPAFYFEIASSDPADWRREMDFADQYAIDRFDLLMEFPCAPETLPPDSTEILKDILRNKHLSFHGATLNLSLVATNKLVVSATESILLDQLDIAKKFGCDLFTFHAGEFPYFFERVNGPLYNAFAINVRTLLSEARAREIELCVENLKNKNHYPQTIKQLDEVFSLLPELCFALDVRHACTVGEDPIAMARAFKSQLRAVHYRADCGLPPAAIRSFFEMLYDIDFDGSIVVEDASLNELNKESRPMIEKAREQLRDFLPF